jgi:hypothetical protein
MNDDFLSAIIRLLAIYVGVYLFMGACETFGYALTIGVVFGGLWLAERLIAWRRSLAVLRAGWSRARVWLANCGCTRVRAKPGSITEPVEAAKGKPSPETL